MGLVCCVSKQDDPKDVAAWKRTQAFYDRWVRRFQRNFDLVLETLNSRLTNRDLETAVSTGQPEILFPAIDDSAFLQIFKAEENLPSPGDLTFDESLELLLAELIRAKAELELRSLLEDLKIPKATIADFVFDLKNPSTAAFIRQYPFDLIREIKTETRLAIRDIVGQMVEEGVPPRNAARIIRQHIGLTRKMGEWVENRRRKLYLQGFTGKELDRAVEAYRKKLIRWRTENIARTEITRAESVGQVELWRELRREGILDSGMGKTWIAGSPPRTDVICRALHAHPVIPIDDSFKVTDQKGNVVTLAHPPAHPMCRCGLRLKPLPQ